MSYFTTKDTKNTKVASLEHEAPYALLEKRDIEVHHEADPMARELQVGQNLRLMEARKRLDRLYLHDDLPLDQQIEAIARIQYLSVITDWQGELPRDRNTSRLEFMG